MIILLNLISLNNNIAQFDDRAVRRRRDTTARGGLVKILSWMRHCINSFVSASLNATKMAVVKCIHWWTEFYFRFINVEEITKRRHLACFIEEPRPLCCVGSGMASTVNRY